MPRVPSVGLSPTSRPQFQAPGVVAYQGNPLVQQAAQTGARMQKIGQVVGQIGIQVEDKINDARTREFANTFENGVNKLFLEYKQKKGKEAVDGLADFQKGVQELYDGSSPMLMNDAQRTLAKPIADRIRSRADLNSQSHYLEASAQYEQTTNLQSQAVLIDSIVANPEDPEALVQFGRLNNLFLKEARSKGMDDDQAQVFALGKRDTMFQAVVTAALDSEDSARIEGAQALIAQLPEGVISKTQRQSLNQLTQKKSRESKAFQWATEGLSGGKTYQSMLQEADELAKTNPLLAREYQRALDTRFARGERAKQEAEDNLFESLSRKLQNNEELTADERQQAADLGILWRLDQLSNKILDGRDVTTRSGNLIVAEYLDAPSRIAEKFNDKGGPTAAFRYLIENGVSTDDAFRIVGQYNHFIESAAKAQAQGQTTGKGSSSRKKFNDLSTDEDEVILTRFSELDEVTARDTGKSRYNVRVRSVYTTTNKELGTAAVKQLNSRFKIDTIARANIMLAQIPEGQKVDRNELLQKAAEFVYKSGFIDEAKTVNRYTHELKYLPKVSEELAPYLVQARQDLQNDRQRSIIRQQLQSDPRMREFYDPYFGRPQSLDRIATENIMDPKVAAALADATKQAAIAQVGEPISDFDVQYRAGILAEQDREQQALRDSSDIFAAESAIARELLYASRQDIQKVVRTRGSAGAGFDVWLDLPMMEKLKQQYLDSVGEEQTTWEQFALMFYPGSDSVVKAYTKKPTKYRIEQALRDSYPEDGVAPPDRLMSLRMWFLNGRGEPIYRKGEEQGLSGASLDLFVEETKND